MRKYSLNEVYFDIIDSHEKAYWLGFITADAHIFTNGKIISGIQIELGTKDASHLEAFRLAIGSNAPITTTTHGKYTERRLRVCSTKLANALQRMGLNSNKTFSAVFANIDKKYYSSYILGYFDGDGSITITQRTATYFLPRLQFVGNMQILEKISSIFHTELLVNSAKLHPSSSVYRILYGGRIQVKKIASWMYQNSPIYLKRKYHIFDYYGLIEEKLQLSEIWC